MAPIAEIKASMKHADSRLRDSPYSYMTPATLICLKQSEGARRPTERSVFNFFFSKVGCYIGIILGLRQTEKGVKMMATAGR